VFALQHEAAYHHLDFFEKNSLSDFCNYRPISLLCTDYKIIVKALAKRIIPEQITVVLPAIIHGDQTGS
jgi:hypothetical protein